MDFLKFAGPPAFILITEGCTCIPMIVILLSNHQLKSVCSLLKPQIT